MLYVGKEILSTLWNVIWVIEEGVKMFVLLQLIQFDRNWFSSIVIWVFEEDVRMVTSPMSTSGQWTCGGWHCLALTGGGHFVCYYTSICSYMHP